MNWMTGFGEVKGVSEECQGEVASVVKFPPHLHQISSIWNKMKTDVHSKDIMIHPAAALCPSKTPLLLTVNVSHSTFVSN